MIQCTTEYINVSEIMRKPQDFTELKCLYMWLHGKQTHTHTYARITYVRLLIMYGVNVSQSNEE